MVWVTTEFNLYSPTEQPAPRHVGELHEQRHTSPGLRRHRILIARERLPASAAALDCEADADEAHDKPHDAEAHGELVLVVKRILPRS